MKKTLLLIVASLCTLLAPSVSSALAPTTKLVWWVFSPPPYYDSASAACQSAMAAAKAVDSLVAGVVADTTQMACLYKDAAGNGRMSYPLAKTTKAVCPDGSNPDTSKPLQDQCPEPCDPETPGPNTDITTGWKTGPDPNSAYAAEYPTSHETVWCSGTCQISPVEVVDCFVEGNATAGYFREHCVYKTSQTGTQCSAAQDPNADKSPPTAPPPEKNRCPLGTSQTGTDSAGIPICTGNPDKAPPTKDTTTTTTSNPDGSTTTTKTETTTNSDGSNTTKTTTTTTATDGTSTSSENTTVGTKTDGTTGKDDSSDQTKNEFCKQNPTLNICRNSQISGSCGSISCDGDAIQCAIAREVAQKRCFDQAASDALQASGQYALGNAVFGGDDPLAGALPTKENASQVSMGALDSGGFLGGGACFPDKTFTVNGKQITLSFTSACSVLIVFRYVIMIVALLVAFRILSGAIIRE